MKKSLIFITLLLVVGPLSAQTPADAEPSSADSVKVEKLEQSVVSAVMPKTKLTREGVQVSVRGSVLENVGTANDVLNKTPGLIKTKDGLEVIGKGAPLIYINGRKVTDNKELDRLMSNEIQNVEVITNPGAAYDATVRAVVKIKTIKRQGEGFGFNAGIADDQNFRIKYLNDPSANFDANYRIKGVDIFAGVNYNHYSGYQKSDTLYQKSTVSPETVQDGSLHNEYYGQYLTVKGGLNWQISDNHSVGFKVDWTGDFGFGVNQRLDEVFYMNGIAKDTIHSRGISKYADGSLPAYLKTNVYYNGNVGKLGIDFNFDYYGINTSLTDLTKEMATSGEAEVFSQSDTRSGMYAGKLVLSYPIWKGNLQVGTEQTYTRREENYIITGTSLPSSESKVAENNIAAFASYGFALPKVGQFSAGLRYEHVDYKYEYASGGVSEPDYKKYDNVFPTVSYAGAFGKFQVMANYSTKTSRPGYYDLSDGIRYNSRYILQSGNSHLQPQIINDFGLTGCWKFLVLSASYNRVDNAIATWSTRYNDQGMVLVKPRNIEDPKRQLSVFLNATPTVGIWNMNYTVGVQNQWWEVDADGYHLSFSNRPMWYARLLNTLSVKGGWQFELGGEYHSPMLSDNILITTHYFDLTAAIQKSFLPDKSLVLRLEGADLAGLGFFHVYADFGAHYIRQSHVMDTQRVKLSLRYKFNTAVSKYKGSGAGKDAAGRMKK